MIGVLVTIAETEAGLVYNFQSPPGTATPREVAAYAVVKSKLLEAGERIASDNGGKLVDAETLFPFNNPSAS